MLHACPYSSTQCTRAGIVACTYSKVHVYPVLQKISKNTTWNTNVRVTKTPPLDMNTARDACENINNAIMTKVDFHVIYEFINLSCSKRPKLIKYPVKYELHRIILVRCLDRFCTFSYCLVNTTRVTSEKYHGKVIILSLFGFWAFLQRLSSLLVRGVRGAER